MEQMKRQNTTSSYIVNEFMMDTQDFMTFCKDENSLNEKLITDLEQSRYGWSGLEEFAPFNSQGQRKKKRVKDLSLWRRNGPKTWLVSMGQLLLKTLKISTLIESRKLTDKGHDTIRVLYGEEITINLKTKSFSHS